MSPMTSLPPWAARLIAIQLIAVLSLTIVGLIIAVPFLVQLARTAPELTTAAEVVGEAPDTIEQVERIDRNVQDVVPSVVTVLDRFPQITEQIEQLLAVAGGLSDSASGLESIGGTLADFGPRIDALQSELDQLQGLAAPLTTDLGTLADASGPLTTDLARLADSAESLATLAETVNGPDLTRLVATLLATLSRFEQHVKNLDQKTGPVLLPDLTGVR